MVTCKTTDTIGQKLTNHKDLAINKPRKLFEGVSRPCKHCVLCGCCGKHNKSMVPHVSLLWNMEILKHANDKKWNFLHSPKTWHVQTMAFMQWLVWYAMNSMLAKPWTNFPWDGHRTTVLGIKWIAKVTKTKLFFCHTIQRAMAQ